MARMEDSAFSYAAPEDPFLKRFVIRLIERASGLTRLKEVYFATQRDYATGGDFWASAVAKLQLDVRYDAEALSRIPKQGPLVVVANHPYGVVDGVVMCALMKQVRPDFVVLTNAVLMKAPEVREFVLPIDFSETPEARETNLKSRAEARVRLDKGGAVVVFPAGAVSTSPDRWGRRPAVDWPWQPFVAQLVQRSLATVAPIWFGGQNSRLFQIVSHMSLTLRLALLFHEVNRLIGATIDVEIGAPVPFERLAVFKDRQTLAMHLRALTYALAPKTEDVADAAATDEVAYPVWRA